MEADRSVVLVIPARYASSRFPGKPLAILAGKSLIQHVYERASASSKVDHVLVATDDHRIREVVEGFGGNVVLAEGEFRSGTDRVAAVAKHTPGETFVDLQGDEIPLHPDLINDLVDAFQRSGDGMGTLKRSLVLDQDLTNPGVVKVVTGSQDEALYFSRAPIPCNRDGGVNQVVAGLHYIHLGVYIYSRQTLLRLAELPTGRLEDAEKLEQLRALEHGIPIRVWETTHRSLRIDRPEDLEEAASVLLGQIPCEGTMADTSA